MKFIEIFTRDVYLKGKYLFTIGQVTIKEYEPSFHLSSKNNPSLFKLLREVRKAKESDR